MSIAIRPAVESDIAELSHAMAGDVSPEQLSNRWQEHIVSYRVVLVALLDGDVAGTVSMGGHNHRRPDSLRLFALDTAPAVRRRGIGSALVNAVEREARLGSLGHVNLEVAIENSGAMELYRNLGYRRVGQPIVDSWQRHTPGRGWELVEGPAWIMTMDVRSQG
jgi:ribosomal protein S18 acetylase RimI-like enzyme